ncbi:peptidoglycan editing factor PgeF [Desulfohalovibrio reitneri]|uniref:peptidoglycan editing factor PgeF n=1 Tax=Desulfohalovibrio reitneri TaxID=1307759 RepID=UPI0004A6A9A6|nr:peptidoglycan editing factor PgeF [Desulfohalovibrio reitneri]
MKFITRPLALPFAFPFVEGVRCVFGTRLGGFSADPYDKANISLDVGDDPERVLANRRDLQQTLDFTDWVELKQVHGVDMLFDPPGGEMEEAGHIEADGLATAEPGQALVIKTADCQPVMLAHKDGRHVAALHVGWRGNAQNFPAVGVESFCTHYGLDPADLVAVRGPSLGPDAAFFDDFESAFSDEARPFYSPETQTVDLWRMTRAQLREAGVRPENIHGLDLCTHSLPEMFFSYRREKTCGRMGSFIWISRGD